jgi:membrane protease YdiL (CAAX protease family)
MGEFPTPITTGRPELPSKPLSQKLLFGPNGLRAGWRLLMFSAIVLVLASIQRSILRAFLHRNPFIDSFSPGFLLVGEGSVFAIFVFASWTMAKMEGRTLGDYGLPWRSAFRLRFWQGVGTGFVSISVLMGALSASGAFHFGTLALSAVEIPKYAVLWGIASLAVAFFEEFCFRGYALFTLSTGIGFWPAAAILSVLFGYVHHGNSGESWLGAFAAGLVGFLFCLLLRRTGDLWMPIGFHAAWDWGETYFYSVPDSGLIAPGHLMDSSLAGPRWLSGGTVGPEASWLCLILLIVLWCIFAAWLREAKYPNPLSVQKRYEAADNPLKIT